jgi:3'-phosphoadenosine 5'-phosphosulfate sulfotransferase (PAPS reductase)/FAD synthetase
MNFKIKACLFCHKNLPIGHFRVNPGASDGHWGWCKQCEKMYGYYESKGNEKHIVSFSGGKDSTAMLLKMIELKMPIDAVLYYDCTDFEFPQMAAHIALVEKNTGINIIKIRPKMNLSEYAFNYLPQGKKQLNGWPTPSLRWCTMMKINALQQTTRQFRPYIQYIGFSSDENDRVLKSQMSGTASTGKHTGKYNFKNRFPLVEWGMTEKDCLAYCRERGYHWEGLYDHFDRVSCWCCPLQKLEDLRQLRRHYPDLWNTLKTWDKKMPRPFQNKPGIFERIEREVQAETAGA